jgi:single-strand DNA-binding protein
MADFNKVYLMGRLVKDVDLKYTPGGTAVAEFRMAVNRNYTTSGGEKREETLFIEVTVWGRRGEVVAQYCSKGSSLFIEGRLKQDNWETKDGQKRSKITVVCDDFQFIGSKPTGGGGGAQQNRKTEPEDHISDDDVPF